jgi:hypothetical protein
MQQPVSRIQVLDLAIIVSQTATDLFCGGGRHEGIASEVRVILEIIGQSALVR